jgi:hypothetical protein
MVEEHLSKEVKQRVFELTNAVYRVTDCFPASEVLRTEIRREAAEVLKRCVQYSIVPEETFEELMTVIAKIRGIRSLLWLSRSNGFVPSINMDVLEREYRLIEGFFTKRVQTAEPDKVKKIEKRSSVLKKDKEAAPATNPIRHIEKNTAPMKQAAPEKDQKPKDPIEKKSNSERQKVITEFLGTKDKVNIKDIATAFKDISTKTVQRDLQDLIEKNVVERAGERRWALYSLKRI